MRVDVSHRFSDFLKLHAKLQPQLPQLPPAFPLGRTPFVSDGVKKERAAVLALYLQAAVAACAATAEPADADRCADELCAFLGVGQDAARALEPATPPRARDLSISSSPRSSVSATPPRPASLNDLTAATPTPPAASRCAGRQRGGAGERGAMRLALPALRPDLSVMCVWSNVVQRSRFQCFSAPPVSWSSVRTLCKFVLD